MGMGMGMDMDMDMYMGDREMEDGLRGGMSLSLFLP